ATDRQKFGWGLGWRPGRRLRRRRLRFRWTRIRVSQALLLKPLLLRSQLRALPLRFKWNSFAGPSLPMPHHAALRLHVEIGSPANIDANAAHAMINPNLRCANAAAESVRADTAPIISARNIGNPPVLGRRKWFAAARPRTAGRIDHIIRASPNERRTSVDGSNFLDWPEASGLGFIWRISA